MLIHPEIIVTPDYPTVKIRQPRDQVNLEVEIPKILHTQGWGCGTYFNVHFVSHDRTKLLAAASFLVTEEVSSIHTNEANPYQPVTKTLITRKAERLGDWWLAPEEADDDQLSEPNIVWNPGKKLHQVKQGDRVLFENADKAEASYFLDHLSA